MLSLSCDVCLGCIVCIANDGTDKAFFLEMEWRSLSVGYNCEPCKNGWTNQDAIWGRDELTCSKEGTIINLLASATWQTQWNDLYSGGNA